MNDRLKSQLSSGRWLLTMAVSVAFILLVVSFVLGRPSITGDAIAAIVGTVFANYFNKPRKDEGSPV